MEAEGSSSRCKQIIGNVNERTIPPVEKGDFELFHKIRLCDFVEWADEYTDWNICSNFPGNNKPSSKAKKDRKKLDSTVFRRELGKIWLDWLLEPKPGAEALVKKQGCSTLLDSGKKTVFAERTSL